MRMGRVRMRMGRVRMKMNMRMMTLYLPEISSQGGGGGGRVQLESFRVSNSPGACLFRAKARTTSASTASFREKSCG